MFDVIPFVLLGTYALFLVLDLVAPARRFEKVKGWRLKGLASFVVYVALATFAPLLWTEWLGEHRLIDASGLGTWGGAVVALLVLELGVYLWHRSMHRVDFLWRWFHQMHHSAERIDAFGAFWFSPLDMLGFTLVGSLATVWAVGMTAEAAILANAFATFLAIFQHANIRTPKWLGYFIERPEAHGVHHQRGVHAFNYSDLPLWDLVFGTFRGPETWEGKGGFWNGASSRVGAMLIGRDVSQPPEASEAADVQRYRPAA